MTRPEWCPVDLWDEAVRLQDELYNWTDGREAQDQDTLMFARALLAERERCEYFAMLWRNGVCSGRNIAMQIRLGTKAPATKLLERTP